MKPKKLFDYRIVQTDTGWMPQRGVSGFLDGISSRVYWCDGVPCEAPSEEIAKSYVESMRQFDARETAGRIVWSEAL